MDERARILSELGKQHQRMPIQDVQVNNRFGRCKTHRNRKNEYYDTRTNQAYCTTCAIELAQGNLSDHMGMIPLDTAYNNAKERAKNQDVDLDVRMQQIRRQMDKISQQINSVKNQAQSVKAIITQIVEKALKDLYNVVQDKTDVLKSDRLELAR